MGKSIKLKLECRVGRPYFATSCGCGGNECSSASLLQGKQKKNESALLPLNTIHCCITSTGSEKTRNQRQQQQQQQFISPYANSAFSLNSPLTRALQFPFKRLPVCARCEAVSSAVLQKNTFTSGQQQFIKTTVLCGLYRDKTRHEHQPFPPRGRLLFSSERITSITETRFHKFSIPTHFTSIFYSVVESLRFKEHPTM